MPDAPSWAGLYDPIVDAKVDRRPYVVAHLAQSLDGCIAMPGGESQWISGEADLDHTHRLRALCDAVLVGAHTVIFDDPQLTTRRVPGPSPLRVIVDPNGRVKPPRRVFDDGSSTLVMSRGPRPDLEAGGTLVESLPSTDGVLCPTEILAALHRRGVRRVLVEGGGVTVSRFLAAGCVDRLHLVMAPLLVGGGRRALSASLGASLAHCPRPPTQVVQLGNDWLFDCDLST